TAICVVHRSNVSAKLILREQRERRLWLFDGSRSPQPESVTRAEEVVQRDKFCRHCATEFQPARLVRAISATDVFKSGRSIVRSADKRGERVMPERSAARSAGAQNASRSGARRLDVGVLSIATAVPPHIVTQRDAVKGTAQVFSHQFSDFDRIAAV